MIEDWVYYQGRTIKYQAESFANFEIMRILKLIGFASMLIATSVFGDTQQEINHLLDYVANTDCQYDRNGQIYDGLEARDHINMKYEYYKAKIETTEDFIKFAATKSKLSGEKYKIRCPDYEPVYAGDWLINELIIYRKNNK